MKSYLGTPNLPRGIRNNNPGNLIITNSGWLGKVPLPANTDGQFEQFTALAYGIRAMAYDAISDINKGANTITKFITTYAPPTENNTQAYINGVANAVGMDANAPIVLTEDFLVELIKAQVKIENGPSALQYVTDDDIKEGLALLPENLKAQIKKKNLPIT